MRIYETFFFVNSCEVGIEITGVFATIIHDSFKNRNTMVELQARSEKQLVKLFQEGNISAMEVLVFRHKESILKSIRLLIHDNDLAEDIFQDVFINIIDALRENRYSEEGKFLPWARRIAHNLCVDQILKRKRMPKIISCNKEDFFEIDCVERENPETKIIDMQNHKRVAKLVDSLPQEQREVVVLRLYADLSYKKIAEITNCTVNTALGRMHYALSKMRKLSVYKN